MEEVDLTGRIFLIHVGGDGDDFVVCAGDDLTNKLSEIIGDTIDGKFLGDSETWNDDRAEYLSAYLPFEDGFIDIQQIPDDLFSNTRAGWQDISTAPKDGTTIIARMRKDIVEVTGREDLKKWAGKTISLVHCGYTDKGTDLDWNISGPVGYGGIPDEWIEKWYPAPPEDEA